MREKRPPITTRGISLPEELDEKLIKQAAREDRSISGIVRRALAVYLEDGPAEKATEEVRHVES